jgi:predicted HTH transcriptional regulator
MDYRDFLEKRRELIAQIIHEGYQKLASTEKQEEKHEVYDLAAMIDDGESQAVEFKSTLRTNMHTGKADSRMEMAVLKTIAGFLNTHGGTLVIGMSDDGTPVGVEVDQFQNEDKMCLHLVNIVKSRINPQALTSIHLHFEDHNGGRIMLVECSKSTKPVFVKDGQIERFYIRTGPSTTELTASQTQEYIKERFK